MSKPKSKQIAPLLASLKMLYPEAGCSLSYDNPLQLMIATILSAQCTDERVNQVTPALFQKYPNVTAFAQADRQELEQAIRPTGFFHNKAKSIQESCQQLLATHQGQVPASTSALVQLSGVGRKTANVIMGNAFGHADGVVVDTHVKRLSNRLGLSQQQQPEKIEQDLMQLIPPADWVLFPHLMIQHGRNVCQARKPRCNTCALLFLCPTGQLSPLK